MHKVPLLLLILTLSLYGNSNCWLLASPDPQCVLLAPRAISPAPALHLRRLFAERREKKSSIQSNLKWFSSCVQGLLALLHHKNAPSQHGDAQCKYYLNTFKWPWLISHLALLEGKLYLTGAWRNKLRYKICSWLCWVPYRTWKVVIYPRMVFVLSPSISF